jgi:hypothetical protein
MQYVQLTIELITKAFETFSSKKGVEFNKKDANKIFKALDEDEEVERYYFCGAKCTKSKRKCMKEVDDEGMHCYVHDPARKCQGTTIKGANCGSVAKLGQTYCGRHQDQDRGHIKRSNNKAPVDKRTKSSKALKKTHTSKFVSSDDDMTSEDEEPKKRKRNKQESSDEEPSDDDEEDIIAVSFPLSSKVVDITSKKNVPLANTGIWMRYATNPAFLYAKNFTVNGKYIIKLKEKNLYIALCPPELMGKNLPAPEISEKEARILDKMGLQEATSADVEKIEESSADENSDDDTDDDNTSDDAGSDDDSSDDKDSDDGKSNNRPDVESGDDTSKDNPDEKLSYKKPSKDDEKKTSRKKRHSEMPKNAEPSSNVDVSKDEKGEHTFALSTMVRNIRSEKDILFAKEREWMVHPNNDMLEYAIRVTMNGKYIVRLSGKNTYVGLFTLDHLRGVGDVPEMDILERSMLSKMRLQPMSDEERKMLFNDEVEVEEGLPVEGPTDISKMKWKRFHKQQLEYSKNVLVNGKHILKIRKKDIVVGLVTDDHISAENVDYDNLNQKEKEKIFAMGFKPQWSKDRSTEKDEPVEKIDDEVQESNVKETLDELVEKVDDEVQESNVKKTLEDGGPMESENVNASSVYITKDHHDFLKAMGEVYSKITAIEEELREEYVSADGNAEEKELISYLDLLEKEYSNYETWHMDKFGSREPHTDILCKFAKEGSNNRKTIVQSVLDSIQAKEKSTMEEKKPLEVTFETAEE